MFIFFCFISDYLFSVFLTEVVIPFLLCSDNSVNKTWNINLSIILLNWKFYTETQYSGFLYPIFMKIVPSTKSWCVAGIKNQIYICTWTRPKIFQILLSWDEDHLFVAQEAVSVHVRLLAENEWKESGVVDYNQVLSED